LHGVEQAPSGLRLGGLVWQANVVTQGENTL
jgi:hypothetical protein